MGGIEELAQALAKELAEHHATTDLSDIHLLVKVQHLPPLLFSTSIPLFLLRFSSLTSCFLLPSPKKSFRITNSFIFFPFTSLPLFLLLFLFFSPPAPLPPQRKLAMTRLGEEGVRQGAEERSSLLSKLLFARWVGRW